MRLLIAALAFLALCTPASARDWYEAETAHFIIKSRDNEANTREFAEQVERFDRGLRFLNGLPQDHVERSRANKPIIYRFGDYSDMAKMAGAPGSGIGGFFIPRAGASVAFAPAERQRSNDSRSRRSRTDNPNEVLFHEYTHYFMMQNFPSAYPRWYSEGYAEMMSTMRFLDEGAFHIGDVPQSRAYQIFQMSDSRLDQMLDANHVLSGKDAIQHYGTGWLLTHYLSFDPQREARLREFLIALNNGEDSLTAARRIFGDLDELQAELRRYKRGKFPGYDVRPDITSVPAVTLRPIEGIEEELIDEEMTLWRGVTKEEAGRIAQDLRRAVESNPGSSYAHMLLAEAEHDARNYPQSLAAAERAVELDPQNTHAWIMRARTARKLAEADPAYYEPARQYLIRARQVDPADPRPLIEFYLVNYQQTGGQAPEEALIALEQAYDEAGSDTEFRLLLGRQLLLENRFSDARVVLLPALFGGHRYDNDDADTPTPDQVINAVEQENRDAAIDLINKWLQPKDQV